jgi:uncharacterized phage infection (PIP) family protein YhgE
VDPVSLALGGLTAAGGLVGGLYQTTANDKLQKRNRSRIEELQQLEEQGRLGLTPVEQRSLSNDLYAPMQQAAAAGRSRAEQLQAAAGAAGASGADLSRIRQEQSQQLGQAANQVAGQVRGADAAKEQSQLQELEGRLQSQAEMKHSDIQSALGTFASSAGAGAALAASPEKDLRSTLTTLAAGRANPFMVPPGATGATVTPGAVMPPPEVANQLRTAGYTDADIAGLAETLRRNPAALQQLINQRMLGEFGSTLNALPATP